MTLSIAEETVGRWLPAIRQLRSDLDALTVRLDAEIVERLDRTWRGRG